MRMKQNERVNILVVGDMMVDKYVVGTVNRISPEAPVPVVDVVDTYNTLGGCGNVVRNLRSINVNVECVCSVGNDINSEIVVSELKNIGVNTSNLLYESTMTTTKERIVSSDRHIQMLRIDREDKNRSIKGELVIQKLKQLNFRDFDIVIVSDYAKGMITHDTMEYLKRNHDKIIVDPKPINCDLYSNVYMITPNEKEMQEMFFSLKDNFSYILMTKGKDGMILFDIEANHEIVFPANEVDVYNVSGAGDTVVSVMATCIAKGMSESLACKISNDCASYVVTKPDTTSIPRNIFNRYLEKHIMLSRGIKNEKR